MKDVRSRPVAFVVGGGMLGLRMAERLAERADVVLAEAGPGLGGLVAPTQFETPRGPVRWDAFYHVVLSGDERVVELLTSLGMADSLSFSTVASELLDGKNQVHPMSSVLDLLTLPVLPFASRLRVGMTVGAGALLPNGRAAESISALRWVTRWSGRRAVDGLWRPLLAAKLGVHAELASSSFLRATYRRLLVARLQGGTGDKFGWIRGGYEQILAMLATRLRGQGVEIRNNLRVVGLRREAGRWQLSTESGEQLEADIVVIATPGEYAAPLLAGADEQVRTGLERAVYLGCVCVSVLLEQQVTGGYLTYVTADTPYTAVVEMSNLVDRDQFAGYHLVYLPKYLAPDDPLFTRPSEEIASEFIDDLLARYPHLSRTDVVAHQVARARYVMPVPIPGWRELLPGIRTGLTGVYLASNVQIEDGTLNVQTTLGIADQAAELILQDMTPEMAQENSR